MLSQTCRREQQERCSRQYRWAFDLLHSELAFLSWLRPRTPEKGITWPKVCRLAKPAELADLQGDSEQEGCSLNHAASMALPASWYRWQFSGTQKDLYSARKIRIAFAREFRGNALVRLRRTARDSELVHSQLQGRSFHCEKCCRAVGASHHPIALPESF